MSKVIIRSSGIGLTLTLFFCSIGLAGELVKIPKGPAAWTVQVTSAVASVTPEPGAPAPVTMQKIEVVQDATKCRTTVHFTNRQTREYWSLPGIPQILTEDPNGTVFFSVAPVPFGPGSFTWINAACLQEEEPVKYRGIDCFHYKDKVPVGTLPGEVTLVYATWEAWIDSTTLLPVVLDTESELGVFTFQAAPVIAELVVPGKFKVPLENKRRMLGLTQ